MRLSWTDLSLFLHVYEAGSMTAAAERCHLTLAAISARIRGLEESAGIALLVRQARGVAPTKAGEVLAGHARVLLDQFQRLERDLMQVRLEFPQRLVVLAMGSVIVDPLFAHALANAWHASSEQESLFVRESASEPTIEALRAGAVDLGILSTAIDTRGLVTHQLGSDPLMVVAPRVNSLPATATLRLQDLLGHRWVIGGEHSSLLMHLQLRVMAAGGSIDACASYPGVEGVLRFVERGMGITVLPKSVVSRYAGDQALCTKPLEEKWAHRHLILCYLDTGSERKKRMAEAIASSWSPR